MTKKHEPHEPEAGADAKSEQAGAKSTEKSTAIPGLDPEVATLREKCAQLEAQLQRAMADLSNVRRRQAKEMEDMRHRVLEGLAREVLPVLDNFYLALGAHERHESTESLKQETHAMVEGLQMIKSLLQGVLERHGVVEIEAHGKPFDPAQHEAVGMLPTQELAPGHVAQVLQRGYAISDKVIRPTRVLVSTPKPDSSAAGPGADKS